MALIAPFRALRYAPGTDLSRVTSPPHDVMAPGEAEERMAADEASVVHVTIGPAGNGSSDRYAAAARTLASWIDEGTLQRDETPAFYVYEVRHGPPEARRRMHGVFARVALDSTGQEVRPHEHTLEARSRDRLRLLEATRCNAEPIWLLYRDERGWVDEVLESNAFDEILRFTDEEGSEHAVWRVDRPEAVDEVVAQFEDRDLVIADGHHRYRTALEHHRATGRDEDGTILACLVRDTDPGLQILATHRILHTLPDGPEGAVAAANEHWDADDLPLPEDAAAAGALLAKHVGTDDRTTALVTRHADGVRACLLRLKDGHEVDRGRGVLDGLAVVRVHERLLHGAWNLSQKDLEDRVAYTQDAGTAVAAVAHGEAEAALILPPEPVHAVLDVAREGHLMPQKATYFVPKIRSGLVLGPLDEAVPVPWRDRVGQDAGSMDFRVPPLE